MKIEWKKSVIGGATAPGDFCASAAGLNIARVYKINEGPEKGMWFYSFRLGSMPFRTADMSGTSATKQEAAGKVRELFERFLSTPSDQGGGKPGG